MLELINPDRLQKTWTPEGTVEYSEFKRRTLENTYLSNFIKQHIKLDKQATILDVGGRDGDIAYSIQPPQYVHIVDPDPNIVPSPDIGQFSRAKIQDISIDSKYDLIICSHVLGYLGIENSQETVLQKLLHSLKVGGTLALFYNKNTGYMGQLLNFSRQNITNGHYDFFDEYLLSSIGSEFSVSLYNDVTFLLEYPTFESLARCCWFLFGAKDQNVAAVAELFIPKLKNDLDGPSFPIQERIVLIRRIIE